MAFLETKIQYDILAKIFINDEEKQNKWQLNYQYHSHTKC